MLTGSPADRVVIPEAVSSATPLIVVKPPAKPTDQNCFLPTLVVRGSLLIQPMTIEPMMFTAATDKSEPRVMSKLNLNKVPSVPPAKTSDKLFQVNMSF